MAQISKKSKRDHEDLISKLPDEILTNILAFIPTRFAVATSVLSKRWKLLWILVPNLEFDSYWFESSTAERKARFENYLDRVLSLNNVVSLRNVKFYCHQTNVVSVDEWFKSLVMRSAENFHLRLPDSSRDLNLFPDSFFTQKNLVKLELSNALLKVPPSVYFPSLKTIRLETVQLFDDESMKNLLAGCPALTKLSLHRGMLFKKLVVYICSSTLQNLEICFAGDKDFHCEVVIDAPNVRYLRLEDWARAHCKIINLSSLVEVSLICIGDKEILFEILQKISNVKELCLDTCTMEALRKGPLQILPMFHSLTHLTFQGMGDLNLLDIWLRRLPFIPNGINVIFKLATVCRYWPLNFPENIISCFESVKITKKEKCERIMLVITSDFKNAKGSWKLTLDGIRIEDIHANGFLKTFLPVSNVTKNNKAFLPKS